MKLPNGSFLLLGLVLAAYLAGLSVSYRLDSDSAFQLESVQQWAANASPSPGMLRLPDPRDLSRDAQVWSTWWPPGLPFLYAPLAAVLPWAVSLRLTSLLLFLLGSLGWLRLADGLGLPLRARYLYALALAGYAVTIGGAASLRSGDVLAYAAGPWLAAVALRSGEGEPAGRRLLLCGLALGSSYWLRYSLFLAALPMLAYVALRIVRKRDGGFPLGRLAALGAGFALPVLALFLLNLWISGNFAESATGTRSTWAIDDSATAEPPLLAASLAGAPGLGLFQNDLWLTHLTHFSDGRLAWFRDLDTAGRLMAKSLLGIPGTLVLAWGLARARRRWPGPVLSLAVMVTVGFYLILAALSVWIGYNYLGRETRFAAGFLPLAFPFVLGDWLEPAGRRAGGKAAAVLFLVVFFGAPLAFAAVNFARNEIGDRRASSHAASPTGLFLPELSPVPEVKRAVARTLRSPRDVVVLAGPAGWGSSFVMWLESPHRTLPVGTFSAPLGTRYLEAAELRGTTPLRSSRPLRVVLVADRGLVREGWLPGLQSRFPQAHEWRAASLPPHANVTIWFSDLEVP